MLPRLLYITDRRGLAKPDALIAWLETLCKDGLRFIYLREKDLPDAEYAELAARALKVCERYDARLVLPAHLPFLRDFPKVNLQAGKSTPSIADLKGQFGQSAVGYSAHELEEAKQAAKAGADYLLFSPVFKTTHRPQTPAAGVKKLAEICRIGKLPVYALGGVNPECVGDVLKAGAYGVAVQSALQGKVAIKNLERFLELLQPPAILEIRR